jgi:hypothetical protein
MIWPEVPSSFAGYADISSAPASGPKEDTYIRDFRRPSCFPYKPAYRSSSQSTHHISPCHKPKLSTHLLPGPIDRDIPMESCHLLASLLEDAEEM